MAVVRSLAITEHMGSKGMAQENVWTYICFLSTSLVLNIADNYSLTRHNSRIVSGILNSWKMYIEEKIANY